VAWVLQYLPLDLQKWHHNIGMIKKHKKELLENDIGIVTPYSATPLLWKWHCALASLKKKEGNLQKVALV